MNISHTSTTIVTEDLTAQRMGSGDMPVFATPALVALMENAAMLCVASLLEEGYTTVGGSIEVKHLAPSAVGATVSATATLMEQDGRRYIFSIEAKDGDTVVGSATHVRFAVNRAKFLSRMA